MKTWSRAGLAALVSSIALTCTLGAQPLFVDVTDDVLKPTPFVHSGASLDLFPFAALPGAPAALGWLGGVVIADLNGDGWNDIFATNGRGGANALYLNDASGVLGFTEVAARAGVAFPGDEVAAAVAGDLDNDGDVDLYASVVGLGFGPPPVQGSGPNRLFLNLGNDGEGVPVFVEVGEAVGAAGDPFTRSQLPSLVDFDRDGDLDIYVGAHNPIVNPAFPAESPDYPFKRPPSQTSMLLRNLLEETGTLRFEDATGLLRGELSGAVGADGRPIFDSRFNFDGVWLDVDRDGWPDLVQANDLGAIGLFRNQGGVAFRYVSAASGLTKVGAWMSLSPGDVNNDGNLDFFASNVGFSTDLPTFDNRGHALYVGDRRGVFRDVAVDSGVADPPQDGDTSGDFGWGGQLFDFDNDGDLDLFFLGNWLTQGFGIVDATNAAGEPFGVALGGHTNRGHLFENLGGPRGGAPSLRDLMATAEGRAVVGIDNPHDGRSVSVGDLDNDGFPDLVISNVSGRATAGRPGGFADLGTYTGGLVVYRNHGNDNRVLKIRLRGRESNRSGIGARVTVLAQGGPRVRDLRAGEGHLAANPLELTFGLGSTRFFTIAIVRWPSGKTQVVAPIFLHRQLTTLEIEEPR